MPRALVQDKDCLAIQRYAILSCHRLSLTLGRWELIVERTHH